MPFFAGPDLPIELYEHSMVALGLGQAVLGGKSSSGYQKKIYLITCSEHICMISMLSQELSIPRISFVAIPIPDSMSGCISNSEFGYIWKDISFVLTLSIRGSFNKIHDIGSFFEQMLKSELLPNFTSQHKSF